MPLVILVISLLSPGLALAECMPPGILPDQLVANYQLHRSNDDEQHTSPLRFVRLGDNVIRIRPTQQVAEHWLRGAEERHVFYRHFLDAGRSVYYPVSDLLTLNIHRSWQSINSLFDERVLPQLQQKGEEQAFCQTARRYHGKLQGKQLEVLWLTSLKLPAYLKISTPQEYLEMDLQGFGQPAELEQQLAHWRRFDSIDYADVGDSESDPFIARMIRQGFIEHGASGMYDSDGQPLGGHAH